MRCRTTRKKAREDHSLGTNPLQTAEALTRHHAIERGLWRDKRDRRPFLVESAIVLGTTGAGKSTLVNHLKFLFSEGLSAEVLEEYRPAIYRHTINAAQTVVAYMRSAGLKPTIPMNKVYAQRISNYELDDTCGGLSPEVVTAIDELRKDPIMARIWNGHWGQVRLVENTEYFLSEVQRIGMSGYFPSPSDVLRVTRPDLGTKETKGNLMDVPVWLTDASQHNSFKWVRWVGGAVTIIYVIDISNYEEPVHSQPFSAESQLDHSLALYGSLFRHWKFTGSVILFFNKFDAFSQKIRKIPLQNYFPDYTGGSDPSLALEFIKALFFRETPRNLISLVFSGNATDPTCVAALMRDLRRHLVQNIMIS